MALVASSPATIGTTALTFPGPSQFTKLTIRNSNTDGKIIYVATNGRAASITNAEYVLYAGDAIEITDEEVALLSDISIVAAAADTPIYWKLNK